MRRGSQGALRQIEKCRAWKRHLRVAVSVLIVLFTLGYCGVKPQKKLGVTAFASSLNPIIDKLFKMTISIFAG